MKALILTSMLVAGAALPVDAMKVVVRTSSMVLRDHVCDERGLLRTEVIAPGGTTWRVVGGVAPYRMVRQGQDLFGNVCVTIMDATGEVATGCGVVNVRRLVEEADCPGELEFEKRMKIKENPTAPKVEMKARKGHAPAEKGVVERNQKMESGGRGGSGNTTLERYARPTVREPQPKLGNKGHGVLLVR